MIGSRVRNTCMQEGDREALIHINQIQRKRWVGCFDFYYNMSKVEKFYKNATAHRFMKVRCYRS